MKETKTIYLTPKHEFIVPIELDNVTPQKIIEAKSNLEELKIWEGNREVPLGSLFEIKGEIADTAADQQIIFEKSTFRMRRIGQGLSEGEIIVQGDAGSHLGSEMTSGSIKVSGNADHWVGMEMTGGSIEIKGNAGNHLGAAYWGNWEGMKGGKIVVHGNTGIETGSWMAGGIIEVKGQSGDFLGIHMVSKKALIIAGETDRRAGAQMKNGTIIVLSNHASMLPSFAKQETIEIYEDEEKEMKISGPFDVFIGDFTESKKPKGKILVKTG
ncbi:MAG: formylmethanofuran dehydrogenase subunit C [Candidatus Hermodarchaeota archaeon]